MSTDPSRGAQQNDCKNDEDDEADAARVIAPAGAVPVDVEQLGAGRLDPLFGPRELTVEPIDRPGGTGTAPGSR